MFLLTSFVRQIFTIFFDNFTCIIWCFYYLKIDTKFVDVLYPSKVITIKYVFIDKLCAADFRYIF